MFYEEIPSFIPPEPLDDQYKDDGIALMKDALKVLVDSPELVSVSAGYLYERRGACAASFESSPNASYQNPETDDIVVQVTVVVPHYLSDNFAAKARELPVRIKADKDEARRIELEKIVASSEAALRSAKLELERMN